MMLIAEAAATAFFFDEKGRAFSMWCSHWTVSTRY